LGWKGEKRECLYIVGGRAGGRGIDKQLLAGRGRETTGASGMGGARDIFSVSEKDLDRAGGGRLLHRGKAEGRVTESNSENGLRNLWVWYERGGWSGGGV
jgi:hypothetical protein